MCGVILKILPSIVLCFCSNVFGSFNFVVILVVSLATSSIRFVIFDST